MTQAYTAGQGVPPQAEPAPTTLPFPALEIHERRTALADLLYRLGAERDSRREEHRTYVDAVAALQTVPSLPDDEARLRTCASVAATLAHLDEQLRESRLRRLEILDRIHAEAMQTTAPASAEGAKALQETDAEVRLMLAQQADLARRLDSLRRQVATVGNAIPPPAEFQGASGLPLRLIGAGPGAFYGSVTPVPAGLFLRFVQDLPAGPVRAAWEELLGGLPAEATLGGITWHEARALAAWLVNQDGLPYRLPSPQEAEVIARLAGCGEAPFWCADVWTPADHEQRRDLKRFGITLVTVWDPAAGLTGRAGPAGEVPFARYPTLVVYLVTPLQAGVSERWHRVSSQTP